MIYSIAYSKSIDKVLKKYIYDEIVVVEVIQLEEHYNDK